MARARSFIREAEELFLPKVKMVPPWKISRCPCGIDTKVYYNGVLVPVEGYEYSMQGKKQSLKIRVYGKEIELFPDEYYFTGYMEKPYDTQNK
jgi:hypothetical protein